MQGPIAQSLALTICGNARIQGANPWAPDAKLFQFVEFVHFVDLEPAGEKLREQLFAASWTEWYDALLAAGATGFRVRTEARNNPMAPDRMLAGFAGGGPRWLIETVSATGADVWESRWAVGDRNAPDRRIWRVTYGRIARGRAVEAAPASDLGAVAGRMREVLLAVRAFADGQPYLQGFSESFSRAIADLDGGAPGPADLPFGPDGFLSPLARGMLRACGSAWVFGGMGSWNDIGFDTPAEQARYDEVSQALFQVINEAMAAAANSTFPAVRAPEPEPEPQSKIKGGKAWWRPW
jgi:hypothetical protein